MMEIIKKIEQIPDIYVIGKCSNENIEKAEKELNIKFPEEYRAFLEEFSSVSFYGTEICGLNVPQYLNVVDSTLEEREMNNKLPEKMFIVERINVDNILVVSDEKGKIYIFDGENINKLSESFSEYIDLCVRRKR